MQGPAGHRAPLTQQQACRAIPAGAALPAPLSPESLGRVCQTERRPLLPSSGRTPLAWAPWRAGLRIPAWGAQVGAGSGTRLGRSRLTRPSEGVLVRGTDGGLRLNPGPGPASPLFLGRCPGREVSARLSLPPPSLPAACLAQEPAKRIKKTTSNRPYLSLTPRRWPDRVRPQPPPCRVSGPAGPGWSPCRVGGPET